MTSENKLVKTVTDAAVLVGLSAGIGWVGKKVLKESFTNDPSSNVMNYGKWVAALSCKYLPKRLLARQKGHSNRFIAQTLSENGEHCNHDWWGNPKCNYICWR